MKITTLILLSLLSVMLTACGSSPMVRDEPITKPTVKATPIKAPTTTSNTAKESGGYYLDDGPADNAPQDIDSIPDAIPRVETPLNRANKPYTALGDQYKPMTGYEPFKQSGIASWYGKRYHGQKTSSGEIYDMFGMTAAHTILPLPSYVRVTNPANGRSVILRVNDRGPFHADRIIDLSYAAAYKLRLTNTGSGFVTIETIDASRFKPNEIKVIKIEDSKPVSTTSTNSLPTATVTAPISASNTSAMSTAYFVQAGAFKSEVNAQKLQSRVEILDLANNIGIASAVGKDGFYRVKLGPYNSQQEADSVASAIRKKLAITALVVNQ